MQLDLTPPVYFRHLLLPDAWVGCAWASSGLLLGDASHLKTRLSLRREKGKMSGFSLVSLRFRLALLIFLAVLAAAGLWLYSAWVDRQWQPPHFLPAVALGGLLIVILAWLGSDWLTLQRVNLLRQTVQRFADGDLTSRLRLEGSEELSEVARVFDQMADMLEQREALMRELPTTIYKAAFDEAGSTLYVSPQIHRLLGFSADEWLADPHLWLEQLHPEDRERVLAEMVSPPGNQQLLTSEYRLLSRHGAVVWVQDQARVIADAGGRPLFRQGLLQDITERKQALAALNASQERFRSLIENSFDALALTSAEGDILYLSPVTTRILGYPVNELIGRNWFAILHPEDMEYAQVQRSHLLEKAGNATTNVLRYQHRNGSWRWIEAVTQNLLTEPNIRALVSNFRDVTERQQQEAQESEKLNGWVQELERRAREINLLNKMGELLQTCTTDEEAHAIIARYAQQLFPEESGAVCLFSHSRNFIEATVVWGNHPPSEHVFGPDDCWALRRGQPHRVNNPNIDLICRHILGKATNGQMHLPASYLCVPMMAQGEALGILHLVRQEGEGQLTEAKEQLAITVAGQIALALANLRLRETLRMQSIRDKLTDLFNRRYMEESLERELRRAARSQHSLGVIMLDLDHFKQFNDTFGHEAGDVLLHTLSKFMQTRLRGEDIACRYGGEEFVLILVDASPEITHERAEELRQGVKELQTVLRDRLLGTITISAGTANFPEHGTSMEELLRAADAALYTAKAQGRDRVVSAQVIEE
jgi:diguanylate cyclase (GGDEF)-like protein/PAS domain S-box-containing protein